MKKIIRAISTCCRCLILFWILQACNADNNSHIPESVAYDTIQPVVITEKVKYDTDDPAIWIDKKNPANSLIVGTDKNKDGALYVYDLSGKIIREKTVSGLQYPNNVDIEYGLKLGGVDTDIAVCTERLTNKIRVFRMPDMKAVDNGGIPVFEGEALRAPMGISLYKRPKDGTVFAIVSRKEGPADGRYLWQYRLEDDRTGHVRGVKVREFGLWSGKKEIESVAVDDSLGFVYYSDESFGIRKYHADPDHPDSRKELALFGTNGFMEDREGISIYNVNDTSGYILVSDQLANQFHIFKREGESDDPHRHTRVNIIKVSTNESDGSEVTSCTLNDSFPDGLFVAMSDDRTFQFYSWKDIAGDELVAAPIGDCRLNHRMD